MDDDANTQKKEQLKREIAFQKRLFLGVLLLLLIAPLYALSQSAAGQPYWGLVGAMLLLPIIPAVIILYKWGSARKELARLREA